MPDAATRGLGDWGSATRGRGPGDGGRGTRRRFVIYEPTRKEPTDADQSDARVQPA